MFNWRVTIQQSKFLKLFIDMRSKTEKNFLVWRQFSTEREEDRRTTAKFSVKELKSLKKRYKSLEAKPLDAVKETLNNLEKFKIKLIHVNENPWLLNLPHDAIQEKFEIISKLGLKKNEEVFLLKEKLTILKRVLDITQKDERYGVNRIEYLSKHLHTSRLCVLQILCKYPFLSRTSFLKIKSVIELLEKYKMPPENILRDVWIFLYKTEEIEKKLIEVKKAEVMNLKPWMGRSEMYKIQNMLDRISYKHDLLGDQTISEYLSQRLNISIDQVHAIIERYPNISKVNVKKLTTMLDYLLLNKFSKQEIFCGLPKIAKRSVQTIQSRLNELKSLGLYPCSLFVLSKTQKEYSEYINKWVVKK